MADEGLLHYTLLGAIPILLLLPFVGFYYARKWELEAAAAAFKAE